MKERRAPDGRHGCCGGIGIGWVRLFLIMLGVLGLFSLAALPSLLETALFKAGLF